MSWLRGLSTAIRRRTKPAREEPAENSPADSGENPDWIIVPREPLDTPADDLPTLRQMARKMRSEERLRELGLPVYAWMPEVFDDDVARLREPDEVAMRTAGLWHCGFKARILYQGTPAEEEQEACDWLLRQDIAQLFNDDERRFLATPHPDAHEIAQYIWRLDALCVLLWALRVWDRPIGPPYAPPGTAVGHGEVIEVMERASPDPELRPIGEILDLYDLTSRCYWPATYFHINGKPQPPGFNRDVLIEHHHALEWLLCLREWHEWMDGSDEEN